MGALGQQAGRGAVRWRCGGVRGGRVGVRRRRREGDQRGGTTEGEALHVCLPARKTGLAASSRPGSESSDYQERVSEVSRRRGADSRRQREREEQTAREGEGKRGRAGYPQNGRDRDGTAGNGDTPIPHPQPKLAGCRPAPCRTPPASPFCCWYITPPPLLLLAPTLESR